MRFLCSLVVMAALIGGCAIEPELEPLRMAFPHELVTMDPQAHSDAVTRTVLSSVYESLVFFEPGLPVRAGLADRWTNPDIHTWHLHIREGVRFHDGSLLTPHDAVASLDRARASTESGLKLSEISSVRELPGNDRIIEIKTKAPAPLLLTRLESVPLLPADFDPERPVGTGPYEWELGSVDGPIVLRRWDAYWGKRAAYPKVHIRFVPFQEDVATLLHDGKLDVVASVSYTYVRDHQEIEHWRVVASPTVAITYLGLNSAVPMLSDIRVRRAISLAIDRPNLVLSVFPEEAARPAYSLVPPEVFGFSPDHRNATLDLEVARQLAAAAEARPRGPLKLAYAEKNALVAEHLRTEIEATGLEVEEEPLSYKQFYRRFSAAQCDLFLFTWNFRIADASKFLNAFARTRDGEKGFGNLNGAALSNPEIDALIETAAIEPQSIARLEMLQEAVSRVAEQYVYLPLFRPSNLALVRDGVAAGPQALPMLRPQDLRPSN